MWRACRVLRSSYLLEKYKGIAKVRDGIIQAPFPSAIVDKTTQLYGSIDTIQRKFRTRELLPSHLFDTTMEQINHVSERYRLFSVATPNEVSGNMPGMDGLFNRKTYETITRTQHMIGMILNSRDLKFPTAAIKFSKHMERVTTTTLRTLQTLAAHGCSHYGHTNMISRLSAFNPKYTGGPGTCVSLGIGSLLVDNDAEGHFLTPCAMYSDCIYFRTSQHYSQKSGLLMRFVSDVSYIFNIFTMEKQAGTHHDLPSATQKVPIAREERKPVLMAKRSSEFTRSEAALKAEVREKSWHLLGPKSMERASRSDSAFPLALTTPGTPSAPTFPSPSLSISPTSNLTTSTSPTPSTSLNFHPPSHQQVISNLEPISTSQLQPFNNEIRAQKPTLLTDQYEVHTFPSNPLSTDRIEMKEVDEVGEIDEISVVDERHYDYRGDDSYEMDDHEMDHLRISDLSEVNDMHELDELDELGEYHADKIVALYELGELVDDLDEVEKQEKVERKALSKTSKYAAVELSEEPAASSAQSESPPTPYKPSIPELIFSNVTQFNEILDRNEDEQESDEPSRIRAYHSPYSHESLEGQLKLMPAQITALRIAYYDAKSENVLPHISQLLHMVVTKIAASGVPVTQYSSGKLLPAIQAAQEVWTTLPFANESATVTNEIASFFGDYDIILTPACTVFPPLAGTGYPKKDKLLQYNALYYPFRLANCPSMLLPVIRSPTNGMPISLQIVGRPLSDTLVIQVAYLIESLFGPQFPSKMDFLEGDVNQV
eukprot:Phypoly_transcript_02955.p1 GENE.Phypoly_transcript_02955~~Phypoly_transcript_02955.p1  ORF type:complete len:770 (+),score=100.64 Phypoly_transcript_02955:178-2487(+)